MAEKTGELDQSGLDPVTETAGANGVDLATRSEETVETGSQEFSAGIDSVPTDTEQIRARIEQTRSQMGETIDAIQEKLSLANISDQVSETVSDAIDTAKDKAYDATIGKAVNFMKNVGDDVKRSGAFRAAKKNPLPLALIGLGAGLLAYQSYSGSQKRGNGRAYPKGVYDYENGEVESASRLSTAKQSIGDTAHRAYDGITDRASTALETVSSVAGSGYEKVSDAVGNAYSGAKDLAHQAYERAGEYGNLAHEKYDETLEENPLALGAVALAIGAAFGFSIPSSRFEGRLMGDARDQVMERAQVAAGDLIERAKQLASDAGETIKDETRAPRGH
jgi:ElaB/YqjD/DUF883 family membrane-anchored ribosome-binding protein/predicted XRE-type DNA-binding protein